ncbi:hypothetical protein AB0B28_11705 [Glycomyces sp. NPDC046736]|uniref:hypothetical protein n=1 Tax=Glycomyces sp. NPDC046736 TaxID=3155615 RepID=UPI0033DB851C
MDAPSSAARGVLTGRTWAWAVAAVVCAAALTVGALTMIPAPEGTISFAPEPEPEQIDPEQYAAELLEGLTGEFSFVLYDTASGEYLLSHNPDEAKQTMSVVKILIAVGALERGADPGRVAEMISRSDDAIANDLWGMVDRTAVVEEQAAAMGLRFTTPSTDPGRWGDTLMSASDAVRMYEYVLTELPEEARAVILDAMAQTTEFGSDGYDQTFGIPEAAAGLDWAAKQGWGCCKPDRYLLSTGTIGSDDRYIAAIFGTFDETVVDEAASGAEMTAVAAGLIAFLPEGV